MASSSRTPAQRWSAWRRRRLPVGVPRPKTRVRDFGALSSSGCRREQRSRGRLACSRTRSTMTGWPDRLASADILNARMYDPTLGAFISVDPLVAMTRLPYAYTNGNPITFSDPSGLEPWGPCSGYTSSAAFKDSVTRASKAAEAGAVMAAPGHGREEYEEQRDRLRPQAAAVTKPPPPGLGAFTDPRTLKVISQLLAGQSITTVGLCGGVSGHIVISFGASLCFIYAVLGLERCNRSQVFLGRAGTWCRCAESGHQQLPSRMAA
jgi:RHS repeat-associated protein